MSQDTFLIAPVKSGLTTDKSAWMIPEDAFARLNNAYIHEGKIKKRFGSTYTGGDYLRTRLRTQVGTTDGSGNLTVTVPGSKFKIGQLFSLETGLAVIREVLTVVVTGTPGKLMTNGEVAGTYTFNTTTGQLILAGRYAAAKVYFYPSEPVMGLTSYETATAHNNPVFAFDTQFVYELKLLAWKRSGTDPTKFITLHGEDHQFISSQNWLGLELNETELYITNNNATVGTPGANDDPMYSYDGTDWREFRPVFNVTAPNTVTGYVQTCKFIKIFDGRMFLFATTENVDGVNKYYCNRVRFSFHGSPACPVTGSPPVTSYNGWLEDKKTWTGTDAVEVEAGGAGWSDAGTSEEIISVEFIRNRIIVYFERSTWDLVPTGDRINSYAWRKLNSEVGSISPYSSVGFDDAILNIGSNGVSACNGVAVKAADEAIRNDVLVIKNSAYGHKRVYGIRDFNIGMAYWTFPSNEFAIERSVFPNKVLIFNYKENTWATADDCLTCFGHYEQQSAIQYIPKGIIAGNQQGFVLNIKHETYTNAAVMQITNMVLDVTPALVRLTIVDHSLVDGSFINISGVEGVTNISGIHKVSLILISGSTYKKDEIYIDVIDLVGTYVGSGVAARVSRIDILSKQWNPYVSKGSGVFISEIEFAVKKITAQESTEKSSELTVDCYPSSTTLSMIDEGTASGALLGTGILETSPYGASPLEAYQELLWHPVYLQAAGSSVQVRLFLSDTQMLDVFIAGSNLVIEALMLHTSPSSLGS